MEEEEMLTTRKRAQGRSLGALTMTLVLALLAVLLLAGTALAAATPGRPTAKAPKGTITTAKPTFKWSKAPRAAKYEVRAYKGSKLLVRKTGITKLSWKSSKTLPTGVSLTWKVRARNAGGNGAWSKRLAFKVTVASPPPAIGGSYQGGKVAYILQSGDPGYVAGQTHGLIAATADQSTAMPWWNGSYTITGATATELGTGFANTNTIIAAQGDPVASYAAGLARAYNGGGYTDWYLPSKDELNTLFISRAAIGGFDLSPGGAPGWGSGPYWSSSEYPTVDGIVAEYAWAQYFSAGVQIVYPAGVQHVDWKSGADYRVRAVRSF
jgi:Protein of unknown function (DUF1566)